MRFALQVCGWFIGLPLELLIIAALLRGGYRRFPLVFAYTIIDFLTTVVELPSNAGYVRSMPFAASDYAALYWIDETILQVLIYAVVMSLIYQATGKLRSRRIVRAALIAGAILFAGISFLIHRDPALNMGSFMTPWIRDLNFCSAVLDLALWALLIASREKDHRLLLLSGGLGILFTGEAIGESARNLAMSSHSRPISLFGNSLIMLTNLLFLYIWWQALRAPRVRRQPGVTR
jgi:hypothetical protein